jgi:hypothetical protein
VKDEMGGRVQAGEDCLDTDNWRQGAGKSMLPKVMRGERSKMLVRGRGRGRRKVDHCCRRRDDGER